MIEDRIGEIYCVPGEFRQDRSGRRQRDDRSRRIGPCRHDGAAGRRRPPAGANTTARLARRHSAATTRTAVRSKPRKLKSGSATALWTAQPRPAPRRSQARRQQTPPQRMSQQAPECDRRQRANSGVAPATPSAASPGLDDVTRRAVGASASCCLQQSLNLRPRVGRQVAERRPIRVRHALEQGGFTDCRARMRVHHWSIAGWWSHRACSFNSSSRAM